MLGYSVFAMAMMGMRFAGDRLVLQWGAVPMLRPLNALAVSVDEAPVQRL